MSSNKILILLLVIFTLQVWSCTWWCGKRKKHNDILKKELVVVDHEHEFTQDSIVVDHENVNVNFDDTAEGDKLLVTYRECSDSNQLYITIYNDNDEQEILEDQEIVESIESIDYAANVNQIILYDLQLPQEINLLNFSKLTTLTISECRCIRISLLKDVDTVIIHSNIEDVLFSKETTINQLVFKIDDADSRHWNDIYLPEVSTLIIEGVVSKKDTSDDQKNYRIEGIRLIQNANIVKDLILMNVQVYQLDLRDFVDLQKLTIQDDIHRLENKFQEESEIELIKIAKHTAHVQFMFVYHDEHGNSSVLSRDITFHSNNIVYNTASYLKYCVCKESIANDTFDVFYIDQTVYDESDNTLYRTSFKMN